MALKPREVEEQVQIFVTVGKNTKDKLDQYCSYLHIHRNEVVQEMIQAYIRADKSYQGVSKTKNGNGAK